tara:strand:+ start:66 stop:677 length:612 start_codon:yes stop_codon:yes gene_type:complete
MQDPKKINISTAVIGNGKTYSIEHHEDTHDTKVKVVDNQGVASYHAIGGGSGVKTFEWWTDATFTIDVAANTMEVIVMDGQPNGSMLTITSSSNLYNGGRDFDFSSLSVGQAVAITYQFYFDSNLAGAVSGGNCTFTLTKSTGTDNIVLPLGGGEPTSAGQLVSGTVIVPVIDAGTASLGGLITLASTVPVRYNKRFVGITVL